MPSLAIRLEGAPEVEARLERIGGRGAASAASRAINRAVGQGRTMLRRSLASASGLPQKTLKGRLGFLTANPTHLAGSILVREGKPIPLIQYVGMAGFKSGLGIAGRPYKLSDIQPVSSGAFFAQFKSGHRSIFTRTTRARIPIEREIGPTVPDIVEARGMFESLKGPVMDIYRTRLEHELERLIAARNTSNGA